MASVAEGCMLATRGLKADSVVDMVWNGKGGVQRSMHLRKG
jgi:hypothetical protein